MIEYRNLTSDDIDQMTTFAIDGLRPELYPMRLDRHKVQATVEHFTRSTRDFNLVAFDGDRIVGAIAALVYESPWFERCEASIVMFRAVVPGTGCKLLAALLAWVGKNPMVRRLHAPIEFDAPDAMERLLRRKGFNRTVKTCILEKE